MTNDHGGENDGPDEYPTEVELPDAPATVDDTDPFIVEYDAFDSIDEWATAEWLAQRVARASSNDDGKEPYPDGVEKTEGWPDDDVELPPNDTVPNLNIGDIIDTPYGRMQITDIETHNYDHPHAHIDTVLIDGEDDIE
ncbi:hypothetical protein [Natronomonas amylolytica]|uniref:hypothetical protein n=1 Tax=Natronomonas amylolytica TaxID=3108498 RepID=UPI0030098BA8